MIKVTVEFDAPDKVAGVDKAPVTVLLRPPRLVEALTGPHIEFRPG
ncbi:hypothetical protein ACFRKB_06050 [Streptomyces scopuliridis]